MKPRGLWLGDFFLRPRGFGEATPWTLKSLCIGDSKGGASPSPPPTTVKVNGAPQIVILLSEQELELCFYQIFLPQAARCANRINLHNFCQSAALPQRSLARKVILNVLHICILITFPYWITFMHLKRFPHCMNTEHLEVKYTEMSAYLENQ